MLRKHLKQQTAPVDWQKRRQLIRGIPWDTDNLASNVSRVVWQQAVCLAVTQADSFVCTACGDMCMIL
jgi:hypothetical protein